jgi:hypothetical protein
MSREIIMQTTIQCPSCNHRMDILMPFASVQLIYECEKCYALIRPKKGDCCVFCSYGSVPCPSTQQKGIRD